MSQKSQTSKDPENARLIDNLFNSIEQSAASEGEKAHIKANIVAWTDYLIHKLEVRP